MICEIICVAGFLCMLHLDIVHISSVCVHIICILSEHMRIMHILSALVLHMFFPNKQHCQCDLYVISTTLYRSLHVVHWHIYTLFVMYLSHSSYILLPATYLHFPFLTYCLHTHMSSAHHLYIICTATHGQHGPELSFTVTGICYWMEFVAGMLNFSISGLCKWFAR